MAARSQFVPAADDELLLAEEAGEQRPAASWRLRPKLLVPLAAVGLCAAAVYHLKPGKQVHASVPDKQTFDELSKFVSGDRKKLLIEEDMHQYVTPPPDEVLSRDVLSSAGGSTPQLPDAASKLFDHVVSTSGVEKELTDDEQAAFKKRFVDSMVAALGEYYWVQDYVGTSGKHLERTKPVMTQALASAINTHQTSFTVEMKDWMLDESHETFNSRLGRTPFEPVGDVMDRLHHKNLGKTGARALLPQAFDSREAWPACKDVIGRIHNQGRCGDCWVFGAMGPLDSRLCIHTKGEFSGDGAWLSRGMGASCATKHDGCQGGWEYYVYQYIEKSKGLVTEGCNPYFAGTDYAHHWDSHMAAPACPTTCDSKYGRSFEQDLFRPLGVQGYRLVLKPDEKGIEDMKNEIMQGGPCAFGIYVVNSFMGYSNGIYNDACGGQANHAVHAIGWGEGYMLGQNSWGSGWGDAGRFKVAHCVPTDFTVPGPITGDRYPLPFAR